MEGTGSFGAGLLRFLADYGLTVIEVDRPDRSGRRRNGKCPTRSTPSRPPALSSRAAPAVSSKSRDAQGGDDPGPGRGPAGRGMKARIQAGAQLDAIIVSAPEAVRSPLREADALASASAPARPCRPGPPIDPASATKAALRSLARRWQALQAAEIDDLDAQLTPPRRRLSRRSWSRRSGVGVDTAGPAAGHRRGQPPGGSAAERSFARLCGVAPVPVSSVARADRHRLHRGGELRARTAPCGASRWSARTATSPPHYARRTAEGRTKKEILRCLRRYIASEAHPPLTS